MWSFVSTVLQLAHCAPLSLSLSENCPFFCCCQGSFLVIAHHQRLPPLLRLLLPLLPRISAEVTNAAPAPTLCSGCVTLCTRDMKGQSRSGGEALLVGTQKGTFLIIIPKLCNTLPREIHLSPSLSFFQRDCKNFLVQVGF